MPVPRPEFHDVIEVPVRERRARLMVSLPGRYMLANKRSRDGDRLEFACRVVNVSPMALALAAPVVGRLGERVILYTKPFGRLHGPIVRKITNGFVMGIAAREDERAKLEAKLAWLAMQKDEPALPDGRRHARVVPRNPMATLLLADGSTTCCLVIDFSDSGAAVSADLYPEIGTPLAVGKMVGRVVRRFGEGFAVEFADRASLAEVEYRLARPCGAASLGTVKALRLR
jgi:hypothetical protein